MTYVLKPNKTWSVQELYNKRQENTVKNCKEQDITGSQNKH